MTTPDDTDELRAMARHLFGVDDNPGIDGGQPMPKPANNTVPLEGTNSDAPIGDDARERDFTRRFFDDDYASFQQELPE